MDTIKELGKKRRKKMFTNHISDKGLVSKINEYKKCKLIDTETRLVTARGGG